MGLEKLTCYFEKPGPFNTAETIEAAKRRVKEQVIKNVVVASHSGETGLKVAEALKGMGVGVSVIMPYVGEVSMSAETKERLEQLGARIYIGPHTLTHNVSWAISQRFGGRAPVELVAETLRLLSQGMKVCVEITLTAADAGMIPVSDDVVAIAGTDKGADTAIVLKPAFSRNFFDLKIREVIAMPRTK